MFHHLINAYLPELVAFIEIIGIIIVVIGFLGCFFKYLTSLMKHTNYNLVIDLSNVFAVGLQVLMGAEILKSVLIPSLTEVLVLFGIVAIRMMLSLLLHYEMKAEAEHAKNAAHG